MDFRLGERSDAFREEVREFLREHFRPEMIERAHDTGTSHDWEFYRALGQRGVDRGVVARGVRRAGA